MNKWECEHPGCSSTAVGYGGALGLRAIGWHFTIGGKILCPAHRPAIIICEEDAGDGRCSHCTGQHEARFHQECIEKSLELEIIFPMKK